MTRAERRRVLRNMLEDLEIMSGWARWSVGREVFSGGEVDEIT